ncbi:MAG: HlyD family efflux transporter periplasmic adaptor subunit [Planctomycetes bacterium]|nr:HlyD family efflux transporter periplasmic adaptor subunit [Planctomycetota bacterium]
MNSTLLPETAPDRLATVAAEIARLANSNISAEMFVKGLLDRIRPALSARSVALWGLSQQGAFALVGEQNLAETGVTRDPALSRANIRHLLDTATSGKITRQSEAPTGREGEPGAAVLFAPVSTRKRCVGVLQIFLAQDLSPVDWIDVESFLDEVCSSTAYFLNWREESYSMTMLSQFWDRFDQTTAQIHSSLDRQLVALRIANDGRRLLNCDRLSLVIQHGARTRVLAVSGQEQVNHSSNLVRSLAELGNLAIQANREIGTGTDLPGTPAAIEHQISEHLQLGGARLVRVVPLRAPAAERDTEEHPAAAPNAAFAALILEQFTEAWLAPTTIDRLYRYAVHAGAALHNAQTHQRVFLLPVRQALGAAWGHLAGRPLLKLAAAGITLLLAGVICASVPATYRIEARGKLMPAVQSSVFAPWDGVVTEVLVTGGQRVETGQVLARLHNDELQSQLLASRNRAAEKRQQLETLKAEIGETNRRAMAPDELVRLRGRLAQTRVELNDATERTEALEHQLEQLTIRAPITGTVASFQVEQSLLHRPVRRGDLLVEVMDEDAEWRLEVAVPEQRMGHLVAAQAQVPDGRLKTEFVLATTPEDTCHGEVAEVGTRANTSPDQGSVVLVHVAVDRDEIRHCRIGAEAISKIECGQKSLGYVLFGDAVEFVQRHVW